MNRDGSPASGAGGASSRRRQWPFIGIVVLLLVLIVLTPDLFSTGGGGLQTRAQLIVERATPDGNTSFYVESIGTATLYESIDVGLAPLPAWPYAGNGALLRNWTWTNASNTLVLVTSSAVDPVAVNVTVKYLATSGVTTEYVGMYGFHLNATSLRLQAVNLLPGGSTPPAATPLADLPIYLLLAIQTTSGPSS